MNALFCSRVADHLNHLMGQGTAATVNNLSGSDDPSDHIWVVEVTEPSRRDTVWRFGTDPAVGTTPDGEWCGTLFYGCDVDDDMVIRTGIDIDTEDALVVAQAIVVGLHIWRTRDRRRSQRNPIQAATSLMVYAACPYCEFSGETKLDDGWYDNQWDGGRGGFRVTCPSCDKPFVLDKSGANDIQHMALVILGEAEVTR